MEEQQMEEDCTALMEEIIEKLKLLNYEKDFLQNKGMKPLSRAYFVIQINPNEQFNYFKTLVKWLFQQNESQSGDYAKYDDPLTVSQNICNEIKKLGINVDFPPLKLKSGFGPQVCILVLGLIDRALKTKKFPWNKKPRLEDGKQFEEEPELEEEGDDNLDMAEMKDESDDDVEENIGDGQNQNNEIQEDKQVIESKIDQKEWILECERVAPKLKFQIKSDGKEWRSHIENTKNYGQQIKKILPDSRVKLENLSDNLTKVLELIGKKEKNINVNMNELGTEYKAQADELKKVTTSYNTLSTSVKELGDQYKNLTEKYEAIQSKTSEHGSNVTDSSPLMKIKQAIQRLRNDIRSMDLRIGVLNHTVLQHKFKERKAKEDRREGGIENVNLQHHLDELEEY